MDVNAIMLENMKKRIGASSTTPNKVIIKISLLQEGDTSETTIDTNKPIARSNVVTKIVEVVIEEQNLKDVDTK